MYEVKCINNFLWNDCLTKSNQYTVVEDDINNDEFWLEDDNECYNPFPKNLFEWA